MSTLLKGSGGAPGLVIGPAVRLAPAPAPLPPTTDPDAAMARFAQAVSAASMRMATLATRLRGADRLDEAAILDAHAMLVADPTILAGVEPLVRAGEPLDRALAATIEAMAGALEDLDDAYLRERAADIRAAGTALAMALAGTPVIPAEVPAGAVLLAADLSPAETAELDTTRVAGFATAYGGPTGHTMILARALGVPAVVGLGAALLEIGAGHTVILDGDAATLDVDPDATALAEAQARAAAQAARRQQYALAVATPGATADGMPVALWANIGSPDEARKALAAGAEGIGLYRTEFLYLGRDTPPGEEEQYHAYRAVLEVMGDRPVVVRTIDIGGDKPIPYLDLPAEANPFLGWRALRLCMRHPQLFQTQLRALLRAAAYGNLWIMFPMVATVADLAWGREHLQQAAGALAADGVLHRADPPLGIMVETPAAVMLADRLASAAAFFSIGSNDLTQYAMAADRGDGALAERYRADDPAVLRLIAHTARAARAAGIPLGVCGEIAGDPELAPILVGLGVQELSMAPARLGPVKARLAHETSLACRRLAGEYAGLDPDAEHRGPPGGRPADE